MSMTIQEQYERRTAQSAALHARARRSMPGGNTRTSTHFEPYPVVLDRGSGSRIWDVDGNEYIDLLYNYTSLVHGHAYPPIVRAVEAALQRGSSWPASSAAQIELAELICDRVPTVESVRFTNSGTEAGMLAAKLARKLTGRELLIKARFGYHGSYEDLETDPAGQVSVRTLDADYNDAAAFEELLLRHGDGVAAVFLEPVMGSAGVVPGTAEFLRRVQEATRRAGAIFVLDEVISLRLSRGGLQEKYQLDPDLTMMGKIIGGGLSVGALGGRTALMEEFDPTEDGPNIGHAGTFNGNLLTCSAGLISLRELTDEKIARMAEQAQRLEKLILRTSEQLDLHAFVTRAGSLLNVAFKESPVAETDTADATLRAFHLACMNRGLFVAPRGMVVLSTVVGDDELRLIGERFELALADVVAASELVEA
jgi:glutamate-1-semialdehyde 2,1-aminomutase